MLLVTVMLCICPGGRLGLRRVRVCVETGKHSQTFLPFGRSTILVIPYQTLGPYGNIPTGTL